MVRQLLDQWNQISQSFTRSGFRLQYDISVGENLRNSVPLDICQFLKSTLLKDLLELIVDFQVFKLIDVEVNGEGFGWLDFWGFFLNLLGLLLVTCLLNFFSRFFEG